MIRAVAMRRCVSFVWACACALLPVALHAQAPKAEPEAALDAVASNPAREDPALARLFETRVAPLLRQHCLKCHGQEKSLRGGLSLVSREDVLRGGDSGPAVDLKTPGESLLLEAVHYDSFEMPPDGKLKDEEIAIFERWVRSGLPWTPGAERSSRRAENNGMQERLEAAAHHWAYQPMTHPTPPAVDSDRISTPIDAFILRHLHDKGLSLAPEADKATLLRRVYYTVTGLPPTPSDVRTFLADDAPGAWERVVDRLLASPQYGEHWARHWLDLVRFAETNSYERDAAKPFAWRYRDYVIRSFNADKPYDQFIREQLAGDEIDPRSDDALIATGFYRLGIWDDEPVDREQALYDQLDDIVATTGQVFLGINIGCARCHEHKIDPIPQEDYYRFLAFFNGITPYGIRDAKSVERFSVRPLPSASQHGSVAKDQRVLCVTEVGSQPRPTHVLIRGSAAARGKPVAPGFPQILGGADATVTPAAEGAASCGRRRILADWIASPDNPLTARVIVNRIWQYHFGKGLVRTPSDFGISSPPPSYPELLDYLAGELIAGGWRLKRIHRMILLSSVYRASSAIDPKAQSVDPSNELLGRFPSRRLEAESIRDSILAVRGDLNLQMGGPSVFIKMPAAVLAGQSRPGSGWGKSPVDQQVRRTIYVHVKRSLVVPIVAAFDGADTDTSCPSRFVSTQPTQALLMLNSDFLQESSRRFAADLRRCVGDNEEALVRAGLWRVLQRPPSRKEVERGMAFLRRMVQQHGVGEARALQYYCLLLLNLNEFVYVH